MAEAEGITPTASVASVGPGLRYVGNWAYGYSGDTTVGSSNVNLLEFTSGSGILIAEFQFSSSQMHTDNFQYQIRLNDLTVFSYIVTDAIQYTDPDIPIRVIIPPFTPVKAMAKNISSGTTYSQNVALTGRVYDA